MSTNNNEVFCIDEKCIELNSS